MSINKKFIDNASNHIGVNENQMESVSIDDKSSIESLTKVLQNYFSGNKKTEISFEETRNYLIDAGYTPQIKFLNPIIVFLIFLLSIPLLYITSIAFICRGIIVYSKNTTPYIKKESNKNKIQREDSVISGRSIKRNIVILPSTIIEKYKYRSRGIIYIILGIILFLMQFLIFIFLIK